MIEYFQKALVAQVCRDPILGEAVAEVYTYQPLDHVPPYLYIQVPQGGERHQDAIQYIDVDVNLMVRETGLIQTIQLTAALVKILNTVMTVNHDGQQLTFIFKTLQSTCSFAPDQITKTYTYQGRLKIKGEKINATQ